MTKTVTSAATEVMMAARGRAFSIGLFILSWQGGLGLG